MGRSIVEPFTNSKHGKALRNLYFLRRAIRDIARNQWKPDIIQLSRLAEEMEAARCLLTPYFTVEELNR